MRTAEKPPATAVALHDNAERYHSLDVLRGSLMLLGILFHCALAYDSVAGAQFKQWPTSDALAYLVIGSHGFRMPLFFILAGFFAALLHQRRSRAGFATNRLVRVGLPLLVGWLVLVPIADAGLAFSVVSYLLNQATAIDVAWDMTKAGEFFFGDSTLHLWFLYYLLLFYTAMLVISPLVQRGRPELLPPRLGEVVMSWRGIPVLVLPAMALLYVSPMADLGTPNSFVPQLEFVALYGFFFGFGVLVYAFRDRLTTLERGAWPCLVSGLALVGIYKVAVERWLSDGAQTGTDLYVLIALVNAGMIWLLFFGLTGVLLRHLDRPVPAVRYVADASYWCYLVHYPLSVWMPGLLWRQDWAPELKFLAVATAVGLFCFLTYDLFVRPTILGRLLNGRRYPALLWGFLLRRPQALRREPATPV